MSKLFGIANARWVAVLLIAAAGAGGAIARADPVVVQQQLLDALARGDVQAAVALFTDDAGHALRSPQCAHRKGRSRSHHPVGHSRDERG
jgi:hypothetical protein